MKSNFVNLELSIILPTYNESKNLRVMIPKIEKVFKDFRHEIIVVDDNSTDNTIGCLKSLNKNCDTIRLVTRLDKKGIGSALCDGYDLAKGDIILSSDADLSFSVEDMLKLVEGIKAGHELMLGCRHVIEGSFESFQNTRRFFIVFAAAVVGQIATVNYEVRMSLVSFLDRCSQNLRRLGIQAPIPPILI